MTQDIVFMYWMAPVLALAVYCVFALFSSIFRP